MFGVRDAARVVLHELAAVIVGYSAADHGAGYQAETCVSPVRLTELKTK